MATFTSVTVTAATLTTNRVRAQVGYVLQALVLWSCCSVQSSLCLCVCSQAVQVSTCVMKALDTSPVSALGFLKCTNTKEFTDPQQAMTNPWHLHRATSPVFTSKSGMYGCIHGKQKQWLKRVTGSALISVSWENAKEFSTIVRSLWEVISLPINYVLCRSSHPLQREQPSLLSYICTEGTKQCGESSSQWCAVPLISLTKNNGHLINDGTHTERASSTQKGANWVGGVLSKDMFYHVIHSVFSSQILRCLSAEHIQGL